MTTAQTTTRSPAILMLSIFCAVACGAILLGAGWMNATVIGGPMTVNGPMTVRGALTVGGAVTVHGPVAAKKLIVGGVVETSLPQRETPGPAGQSVQGDMLIGGALTVNGPLIVEGDLKIGGRLTTEVSQQTNENYPVTE